MSSDTGTTRTVKRISVELNREKFAKLVKIAEVYAAEKRTHLNFYQDGFQFLLAMSSRDRRNALRAEDYRNDQGLSSHGIALAVKDGFEAELKYWASIAARINVSHLNWTEAQKYYANWLMYAPQRFSALILGRAPLQEKNDLTLAERRQVQNYLRRCARRLMGKRPSVKTACSFAVDSMMYRVFMYEGRQYLSLSSLERGARIIVPLEGVTAFEGKNLRIVLLPDRSKVEVHISYAVENVEPATGEAAAIDVGITEVGIDDLGNLYGEKLGAIITKHAEHNKEKNQKRNKIHALAKKNQKTGQKKKARNIRRFNLGRKKLHELNRRAKIEQTDEINRAIAQFLRDRQPAKFAAEKLDIRGKAQSKKLSRRTTSWLRSTLAERIEFKASVAGCDRKHVNPAYTSQVCPICGYVDKQNRKADAFQCLHCGHAAHSDQVAAINQKARLDDPQITPYTPVEKVKSILLERFNARLESQKATVPGRTSDRATPLTRQSKSETAAGKTTEPTAGN